MGLRDSLRSAVKQAVRRSVEVVVRTERVDDAPPPPAWAPTEPWTRPVDEAPAPSGPGPSTIPHTGELPELALLPGCLDPEHRRDVPHAHRQSCGFCGIGDDGLPQRGRGRQRDGAPAVAVRDRSPTPGCVKIQESAGQGRPLWPIHTQPSVLQPDGTRRAISYEAAVARLADHVLAHREPDSQVLVYGCGQIDLFTIFALQEVFRLLGVRNLGGNAEHCLNAGAVHNEMLTGQEGPFLTMQQSLDCEGAFYLLNGWNGLVSHPGFFHPLLARPDFDAFIIDPIESESVQVVAKRLGDERVLHVRAGSDPHLALAVAQAYLRIAEPDRRFVESFADRDSFERFVALAHEGRFAPRVAARAIAAEPGFAPRIERAIAEIAARLADPARVPINIPSVGLSQTKGAVAHCLWGSTFALAGKYGLKDGRPGGGTLRLPGQINAESEVQGLSRLFFFGRIPMSEEGMVDAARRCGLPDDAYELAVRDTPRPTLDYSDPSVEADRELFVMFGTQFEANLMERDRWIRKLKSDGTTLVVVDPVPDPWTLAHADLVIPSPPHNAAPKLYQNGEWRLTLSVPSRARAKETRSDATILYDVMAHISRRIRSESMLRMIHPDLGYHSQTGYLRERFEGGDGGGLPRIDGEVSRPVLWRRLLDYCAPGEGRKGRLYCRYEHDDGSEIGWDELLVGSVIYGGVGTTRYRVDGSDDTPFRGLFGEPSAFRFFVPTAGDLAIPDGPTLNSGRSAMSDDPRAVDFAVATFNSGKATPGDGMPDETTLFLSPLLAEEGGVRDGGRALVENPETGASIELPVRVTPRVKGRAGYVSFHKSRAQVERGVYVNQVTGHAGRCPYTAQTSFKATRVRVSAVEGGGGPPGES